MFHPIPVRTGLQEANKAYLQLTDLPSTKQLRHLSPGGQEVFKIKSDAYMSDPVFELDAYSQDASLDSSE